MREADGLALVLMAALAYETNQLDNQWGLKNWLVR